MQCASKRQVGVVYKEGQSQMLVCSYSIVCVCVCVCIIKGWLFIPTIVTAHDVFFEGGWVCSDCSCIDNFLFSSLNLLFSILNFFLSLSAFWYDLQMSSYALLSVTIFVHSPEYLPHLG